LDINHLKIFLLDNKKDGIPLVFIHGFLGNMGDWFYQYLHFNPVKHTIFMDLPGFGRSNKPAINYSLQFYTSIILSTLEALSYDKIYLIGHSFGGMIGQQIAITKPRLVKKLILIDTTYGFYDSFTEKIKIFFINMFFKINYKAFLRAIIRQILSNSMEKNKFKTYYRRALALPKEVLLSTFKNMTLKSNIKNQLSKICAQTLIIHGSRDIIIEKSMVSELNRLIPSSQLINIKNGPHKTMSINHSEVNQIIDDFIKN
jgi:3-oxoadipate enol-lactonase